MNLKERIIKSIKKNPYRTVSQVANSVTGASAQDVRDALADHSELSLMPDRKTQQNIAINEQEIRRKHDPYYQIESAAKKIPEDTFFTEADFRNSVVKISAALFRRPADNEMFAKYKGRGRAGNIVYWGHPERIKALKEEGVLL